MRVDEHNLDLNFVFNIDFNGNVIQYVISHLIWKYLVKSQPEIYARMALKRFTAIGRQKYFIDDIETDENFCNPVKGKSS